MTINTKDIEAGDIVVLRDGSSIVAYEDGDGDVCLMAWDATTWGPGGRWTGRAEHHLDIIAIEKKPEDEVIVEYASYDRDFGIEPPEPTLESAKECMPKAIGYVKITINLTDKTKHKIEEVV